MPVEIRSYVDPDFPFVRSLFSAYLEEERARVALPSLPDNFPDTYLPQLILKARQENGVVLVAESGGMKCGFIAALPKDSAPWDQSPRKSVMVMEAHVDRGQRRQGIGRALFRQVESHFVSRGFDWFTLGTFAGNVEAHAFYRSLGYGVTYQFMGKAVRKSG